MAVNDERQGGVRKASSLEGDQISTPSRESKTGKRGRDGRLHGSKKSVWKSILLDMIILIVLAGLCVGIWFGYDAIKGIYAPVFEKREVAFVVEIRGIEYERAEELLHGLTNSDLWYSDDANGVSLGKVTDVRPLPTVEDGKEMMALRLTVSTVAQYRPGHGYYVGTVRLMAGETALFRAEGMVEEGLIISVRDLTLPSAESQTEGVTA